MPQVWVDRVNQVARQEGLPLICRGSSALARERHERDVAGALDSCAKLALMSSTIAGNAARNDFAALSNQVAQSLDVFIVDIDNLIRTESADLLAWEAPFCCQFFIASFVCLPRAALEHLDGRWTLSQKGTSSSSMGSPSFMPCEDPPPPGGRLPLGIKWTRDAVTSCLLRFCPSCPSQVR